MTASHFLKLSMGLPAIVMLCMASPAAAQFAGNSSDPVDLTADEISSQGNRTILKGQVDVRQGDVRVLADNMVILSKSSASSDIEQVNAMGNFYYITPEQEVRGDNAVYEQLTDTFTVTGNVILLQGEDNIVTGDTLVYNLSENKARVVGTCKGRRCGSTGRVKALLKNRGTTSGSTS